MTALHVWTVDHREDCVSVVAGRAPHAERRGVLVVGDDSLASLRQVLEGPGMLAPPVRPIDDVCLPPPAAEAVEWAHQASATGLESTIAASEVSAHPPGPKTPTGPISR